jgi:hypothetical protein
MTFPCYFTNSKSDRIFDWEEPMRRPGRLLLLDEATLNERMTASPRPAAQDAFGHRLQSPG